MKILVCIKPDITGQEPGPFEHLALEAGLCLKESCLEKGMEARVDVGTAGPAAWQDCLVRALGTGADRAVHILTPDFRSDFGSDLTPDPRPDLKIGHAQSAGQNLVPASAVARLMAKVLSPLCYDLILTGVMSQDLMAGQTGPMLAHLLGIPVATAAVELGLVEDPEGLAGSCLAVTREMDGGFQERLRLPLPALVSIQSGVYTPRYPVLSHMLKARQKPVQIVENQTLPQTPEILGPLVAPEQTRAGTVAAGSLEDQVAVFRQFLKQRGLV